MDDQAPSTADLVDGARGGDQDSWAQLSARYQPLGTSVTCRHRRARTDAVDVSQTVWLRLVTRLVSLREPRALPGWLATTTANACLDVIASQRRTVAIDPQTHWTVVELGLGDAGGRPEFGPDEALIRAESCRAVGRGLDELTPTQRQLLLLVVADPPVPYEQISRRLGVPVGSIGPTRRSPTSPPWWRSSSPGGCGSTSRPQGDRGTRPARDPPERTGPAGGPA
ncbi:MAG: RNA polymerase sigma factor [Propionibacteriaceae bacterium]